MYAGVPARKLMSLEVFIGKRRTLQLEEAGTLVTEYRKVYGKDPDEQLLREFFWLFSPRDENMLNTVFKDVLALDGNHELSTRKLLAMRPNYPSFQFLCSHALKLRS